MIKQHPSQLENTFNFKIEIRKDSAKQLKKQLSENLLDGSNNLVTSELKLIKPKDKFIYQATVEFLKERKFNLQFKTIEEIFEIFDTLLDFIDLEEIFSLFQKADLNHVKKVVIASLNKMNSIQFLDSACNFDILIELISSYLGPEILISYLGAFHHVQDVLALYTRSETLLHIENALDDALNSQKKDIQNIATRIINNSGSYFINLRIKSDNTYYINEKLSLKLENHRTNIYVDNVIFNQCKFLFLNIPVSKIRDYDEINSIDEAAEKLDRSMEGGGRNEIDISAETEFWGHCSNLQAWAENNYDTRILHRNLAFPLLKRLSEVGDPIAKNAFRQEIAKRLESGYPSVVIFLISQGYLEQLSDDDIKDICLSNDSLFIENLLQEVGRYSGTYNVSYYIQKLLRKIQNLTENKFVEKLIVILKSADVKKYQALSRIGFFNVLNKKVIKRLIQDPDCILRNFYIHCKGKDYFINYNLSLNLKNKGITDISEIEGIHRMKYLKALDISGNQITQIKGFENLNNLKRLRLSGNPIPSSLIEELGGLDKQGKIRNPKQFIDYCREKSRIPVNSVEVNGKTYEIFNKELILRDLKIKNLMEIKGLQHLSELISLDLSENLLKDLKGIENLKSLNILDLQENQLKDLKGIESLENLEILRLRGNNLDPEMIQEYNLDKLGILDIETRRKLDDILYLKSLLPLLSIKQMYDISKKIGLQGYSDLSRNGLVELLINSTTPEETREAIFRIEQAIISDGLKNALKKIYSKKREKVRAFMILDEKSNAFKADISGHKQKFKIEMKINSETNYEPVWSCNCRIGTNKGFCDHFWAAVIFALKMNMIKIEDWTLCKLPNTLEDLMKDLEFYKTNLGEYKIKNIHPLRNKNKS